MNFIDVIIIIPIIWGVYKGFTKGLVMQVATLFAFGAGIWVAHNFSSKLQTWLNLEWKYAPILAFSILFLGVLLLVWMVAKFVTARVSDVSLGLVNRLAGAAFGALKFALILSVLIFVLDSVEKSYPTIEIKTKDESLLYRPVAKIAPMLIPGLEAKKFKVDADIQIKPKIETVEE